MENLSNFYYRYLRYIQSKDDSTATPNDKYMALSYAVRSQMVDKWINSQKKYHENNPRRIYYLSTEYVFGKNLKFNIINLGLEKNATEAAEALGFSLDELYEQEDDFELGNPSKGTLAACFLDSMATLGMPAMGYGLNYDYAFFQQELEKGIQSEKPYDWLHKGHSWEIKRPEYSCNVGFYGKTQTMEDDNNNTKKLWAPTEDVIAVPHDFPVTGYENDTVNTLRLWSAQANEEFLDDYVHHGDYIRACEEKFHSGRITHYLFPDEEVRRATEMRIKQRYFFVSASLQDIIRRYKLHNPDILDLDKKVVIQLHGSRCAIAVVELMRLLMDGENVPFNDAWRITRNVFAYTCFASSLEQLEKWPLYLMEEIIPRHTSIVYEINKWHLDRVRKKGRPNRNLLRELSIIEGAEVKWVKMSHLAALGSSCVNGVSREQAEILQNTVFPKFIKHVPITIKNIPLGIAIRKWLLCANKPLASFITELIGESWITNYKDIEKLEDFADDSEVKARLEDIKHAAKRQLQTVLQSSFNLDFDVNSFLDIDCKRIHQYKRQVLHILYILSQYLRIKNGEDFGIYRTHIFGGKASPSDLLAKQIIQLINMVVEIVNNDPLTTGKLHVVFMPNYNVSLAEKIIPAADLSEQISAAHREASGTTAIKFAINGAVTIASKSGSNIELAGKLGNDNIVFFGNTSDELNTLRHYKPADIIDANKELKEIFSFLDEVIPSLPNGDMINPLLASLRDSDPYFALLDFEDYIKKQYSINELHKDRSAWLSISLKSIARSGWFSSDRIVTEYSNDIWKLDQEFQGLKE